MIPYNQQCETVIEEQRKQIDSLRSEVDQLRVENTQLQTDLQRKVRVWKTNAIMFIIINNK